MTDTAQHASFDERRTHLDFLAAALHTRGFHTRGVQTPTGLPMVHVVNPDVPMLCEDVGCVHEPDGTLAVVWSFGKRIGAAQETARMADEIARVLAP